MTSALAMSGSFEEGRRLMTERVCLLSATLEPTVSLSLSTKSAAKTMKSGPVEERTTTRPSSRMSRTNPTISGGVLRRSSSTRRRLISFWRRMSSPSTKRRSLSALRNGWPPPALPRAHRGRGRQDPRLRALREVRQGRGGGPPEGRGAPFSRSASRTPRAGAQPRGKARAPRERGGAGRGLRGARAQGARGAPRDGRGPRARDQREAVDRPEGRGGHVLPRPRAHEEDRGLAPDPPAREGRAGPPREGGPEGGRDDRRPHPDEEGVAAAARRSSSRMRPK